MRLLAVRPRGRREIEKGLQERGFAPAAVAAAIGRLAERGFLDDASAARSAVRMRGARYGRARVARELESRGFSRETIAAAFDAEGGDARERETLRRAFEKLWKARSNLEPSLRRRRVFDALTRRGFPAEKISDIIRGWYEVD